VGLGHVVAAGEPVTVAWEASLVAGDREKTLELYATRQPIADWQRPGASIKDAQLTGAPLRLPGPTTQVTWDTTGLEPGCYQVYAVVHDGDDDWPFVQAGKVVVRAAGAGARVPPAVWFLNAPGEELDAQGRFVMRYRVEDADGPTRVTLSVGDGGTPLPVTEALPHAAGAHEGAFTFDATAFENGYYELHARAEAEGEPACEAFWTDALYVPGPPYAPPDASPDGGADGGTDGEDPEDAGAGPAPDAGVTGPGADAGVPGADAGVPGPPPVPGPPVRPATGCQAGAGSWLAALPLLLAGGRRRRPHPGSPGACERRSLRGGGRP
jgi:hypothetical protein